MGKQWGRMLLFPGSLGFYMTLLCWMMFNVFFYIFIICMASYSRSLALLSGLGNKEAEGGGR